MVTDEFILFVLRGNGMPNSRGLVGVPLEVVMPLNTQKPLYSATLEAMQAIIDRGYDRDYGFQIEIGITDGIATSYRKVEEFFSWYCNSVPVEKRPFWNYRLNRYEKLVQRPAFQSPTKIIYTPFANKVAIKETLNYLCRITTEKKTQEMAKPSNSTDTTAALTIVLPSAAVLNANYATAKALMEKIVGDIASVGSINDPATAKFLADKTGELNTALKKIEAVRVSLKEPFLEKGKEIDAIAKDIRSGGEAQLARAKGLLLAWDNEQARLQHEREEAARKQREELAQKASNAVTQLTEQQRAIITTEKEIFDLLVSATQRDELGKIFRERVAKPAFYNKCTPEEVFGDFAKDAEDSRLRMVRLGKAHDELIAAKSGAATAAQLRKAELAYSVVKGEIEMAVIDAHEQLEAVVEAKTEETVLAAEVQKATVTAEVAVQAPEKHINTRRVLKYEAVDFKAIPDSFKMINDERVKAFIAQNKEALTVEMGKNGGSVIVDGMKFFYEEVAVLPKS